jgi:hypothetical protein
MRNKEHNLICNANNIVTFLTYFGVGQFIFVYLEAFCPDVNAPADKLHDGRANEALFSDLIFEYSSTNTWFRLL